jgi:hypothetical protein
MANSITRLFDKITGKKKREKELVFRFHHYKSTARMLAIALSKGMKCVPGFLENRDFISYLTLAFKPSNISFLLLDLEHFKYSFQAESLRKLSENYSLTICSDEKKMEEYITLLWDLFYTPNPPMS